MNNFVRKTRWLGLVALLAGLSIAPATSPAAAAEASAAAAHTKPLAATCFASTCAGLSPEATNCNADAETHGDAIGSGGVRIRLRWSPTCRAAWARIDNGRSGDRARVENTAGQNFAATVTSSSSLNTPMVNDLNPLQAWACVRVAANNFLTCTSPPW